MAGLVGGRSVIATAFGDVWQAETIFGDGEQLTTLMIGHDVRVRIEEILYMEKVNEDFFWINSRKRAEQTPKNRVLG